MLHRHDSLHPLSDIRTRQIRILLLQDSQLVTRIIIDYLSKCSFIACNVSTALRVSNVVSEADYIFISILSADKDNIRFYAILLALNRYNW